MAIGLQLACHANNNGYQGLFIANDQLKKFNEENEKSSQTQVFYLLYKRTDNTIAVKEYHIERYRGSAVLKSPFFKPAKGFSCIIPSHRDSPKQFLRPRFIQLYANFIRKKFNDSVSPERNFGDHMAQLFFYADANALKELNRGFTDRVKNFFKKSKLKPTHPLIVLLRIISLDEAYIIEQSADALFDQTNIFIDQDITLEELKALIKL